MGIIVTSQSQGQICNYYIQLYGVKIRIANNYISTSHFLLLITTLPSPSHAKGYLKYYIMENQFLSKYI